MNAKQESLGIQYIEGTSQLALPKNFVERELRTFVGRLHRAVRDLDSNSSLVERFDELSKVLYLHFLRQVDPNSIGSAESLAKSQDETVSEHAARVRDVFVRMSSERENLFPQRFRKMRLSDRAISALFDLLADFGESLERDVYGLLYEELIRGTFDRSDHQQFFTPPSVVDFVVGLGQDVIRGTVCDPAAGTAGFLAAAARLGPDRLIALEIDERLSWAAGLNLYLHGARDHVSEVLGPDGSLGREAHRLFGSVDCVITNPPFGSDYSGDQLESFALGKGRSSRRRGILFLERCFELLKEGGTLLIVIDEGVLSHPSAEDVREYLRRNGQIEAVVSLPTQTFQPYASVSTSVLRIRKGHGGPTRRTMFARAELVGRKQNGDDDLEYDSNGVARLRTDFPAILHTWRSQSSVAELREHVRGSGPDTYFASINGELPDDLSARLDFPSLHPARRESVELLSRSQYSLQALGELCEVRSGGVVPDKDLSDQIVPYTGLAQIEPYLGRVTQIPMSANALKSQVKEYLPGDVLFSKLRPNLRKIAIVEQNMAPGFVSGECMVLATKVDDDGRSIIAPELLAMILRSEIAYGQIVHKVAGIGRPRISSKDVLSIRVPLPPRSIQDYLCQQLAESEAETNNLMANAQLLLERAGANREAQMQKLLESLTGG